MIIPIGLCVMFIVGVLAGTSFFVFQKEPKWKIEFEDEIDIDKITNSYGFSHDFKEDYPETKFIWFKKQKTLDKLLKYNLKGKVKIKARDGKITIERIDE